VSSTRLLVKACSQSTISLVYFLTDLAILVFTLMGREKFFVVSPVFIKDSFLKEVVPTS